MKGFWRALFGASIGDTSQGRSKRIMRPVDGYEALNAKIKNETENFDRWKESGKERVRLIEDPLPRVQRRVVME